MDCGHVLDLFTDILHYPRNDIAVAMQLLWVDSERRDQGNMEQEIMDVNKNGAPTTSLPFINNTSTVVELL